MLGIGILQGEGLPTITSWGQLVLLITGFAIAAKMFIPMLKNGKPKETSVHELTQATVLSEVRTVVLQSHAVLIELGRSQAMLAQSLVEIERRTRGSDEAIRKVMESRLPQE